MFEINPSFILEEEMELATPSVDMRGESDQLRPCNAANCHSDQARCVGYEKVRGSDRCLHLRCEEFCLR